MADNTRMRLFGQPGHLQNSDREISLLNCSQCLTRLTIQTRKIKWTLYKTEPYVIAADVYSIPPHAGHGGWTWYTGSSAWMYRLGIEAILGITREGEHLRINPCIPQHWPGFTVNYRFGTAMYEIKV